MSLQNIEREFLKKVSAQIELEPEGVNRYRVSTPFQFDDGDHLVIVLKREGNQWLYSDEAHTYMRLTYDIKESDLRKGTRQRIILNTLSAFQIEDRDGELVLFVPDDQYADALFSFVQGILKISDISFLSRERIRSMFTEDFRALLKETVPSDRLNFDWTDSDHDPSGNYVIDCRINGMSKPLFVQALANDDTTRDATIVLLKFEKWGIPFRSLAIFENQEKISRRVLARFTDVGGTQFSSLAANKERITNFLNECME